MVFSLVLTCFGTLLVATEHAPNTLAPVWLHEVWYFNSAADGDTHQLDVFDYDALGGDDYLGSATVSFAYGMCVGVWVSVCLSD